MKEHARRPHNSSVSLAWIAFFLAAGAVHADEAMSIRRIGHSEVRQACMSDGSARMQHYWDVAAFDWGGVVPLNSWYHPQLMSFDPSSGGFEHIALALPHEGQGNEDDPRQRIFAHKGSTSADTSVFFTIFGYEEIDSENGEHHRDSAVMALRATDIGQRMPRRTARVVNLPEAEAKRGLGAIPAACGAPYDSANQLVFAPRQRPHELHGRELFQVFRFDVDSNQLRNRVAVETPKSMTARHFTTCMAVEPKFGLAVVGATTPWKPEADRSSLCVLKYRPTSDNRVIEIVDSVATDSVHLSGPDQRLWAARPTAAVFCDDGVDAYLLVGGGAPDRRYGGAFSGGVYVFPLGKLDGPLTLGAPSAVAPLPNGVEQLRVVGDHVLVSSRGLHGIALKDLLAAHGVAKPSIFAWRYPLPYDTHGFDLATIQGRRYIFLAAGRNGLDVFLVGNRPSKPPQTMPQWPESRMLQGRPVIIALESGGFRQFGPPSLNENGDVACWAIMKDGKEGIFVKPWNQSVVTIALSGKVYCSFSSPEINRDGQVAFWAGRRDGTETLLLWRDGKLEEKVDGRAFRWVSPPRLGSEGQLLFGGQPSNRRDRGRTLNWSNREGEHKTIFAESKSLKLGTSIHGDYFGELTLSPDGKSAAFVARDTAKNQDELRVWSTAGIETLKSPGRDLQLIRFGVAGQRLSFRRWRHEILATCSLSVGDGDAPAAVDAAEALRRRASYTDQRIHFGEFLASRCDGRGNLVAAVVEHVQGGNVRRCLGNQLWRVGATGNLEILVRPLAGFQDSRVVIHSEFSGAVNQRGDVAARIDWIDDSGTENGISQSIVIWRKPEQ